MTVPGSMIGLCMKCRSAIATVDLDGERVPLEYAASRTPRVGLVAINPWKLSARVICEEDLPNVAAWVEAGVSLHQRHAEQCVGRRVA